jgi:hypothetical protein
MNQYEGADVIERPKHAFAPRGTGIHPDRLKIKLAHGIQTPRNVLCASHTFSGANAHRSDGVLQS